VVEFSKNWNPRNYGTFGLSATQLKKIRVDLAAMAKSTFAQVLSNGGYAIVTDASDDVLEITPNIVNVRGARQVNSQSVDESRLSERSQHTASKCALPTAATQQRQVR